MTDQELEQLIFLTRKFISFADELLSKGDISLEEYESMISTKRKFLQSTKAEGYTTIV